MTAARLVRVSSQVPGEPLRSCPALRPRWNRHALTCEDDRSSRGVAVSDGFRPCRCLIPQHGRGLAASRRVDAAFRSIKDVGFHVALNFGAQSHGLFARCLRFAAFIPGCPVVRPRKTRFRLVVSLCRTGSRPLGSLVKFLLSLHRFLLTQALPGALLVLAPKPAQTRSE
jgi:hypothetical protein